ncbi:MAG: indolepyruvate ferredoxin oxidoreductase subunit alpha [Anaerolineaceae bacterium]|nr:indolepyruvate ferredoxin oxidoreductase subunit alpha [Anaerolineaceae bacterium]
MKRLLSGNEAVAYGAWEAGVSVASGYPGTPSTEILETFAKFPDVYAEWAPNEKVALDVAAGASYSGRRSLSTMKHVGLNVAADAFMAVSMTGIEGGLVIVSADDPSMHSSQNEQDNRQLAKFARVPCLDPADSQEAKDLLIAAYDISEQFDTPTLFRMTTRVCHTSTIVDINENRYQTPEPGAFPRNTAKYVTIPANARKIHLKIEQRVKDLSEFAETFKYNFIEKGSSGLGVITGGIAYQYARDVFPDASILKLGMVYPLPYKMIKKFAESVDKLIVLEELDPFIENQIELMGIEIYKGADVLGEIPFHPNQKSIFPITYELNSLVVSEKAEKAGLIEKETKDIPESVDVGAPMRPPVLCPGCPHRSTFYILSKMKVPVNGDIGCYTLGVVPPLSAIHVTTNMGASISTAHGSAVAGDKERHIAVIGDSTFYHTGVPALINVAYNNSNVITVIMDNRITGMTGHQENPGTGKTLQNKVVPQLELEDMVRACGITKYKTVEAYDVKAIETTLKSWVKEDGPAVLITKHECALLPTQRKRYLPLEVNTDICNGCSLCFRIGCPSISKSEIMDPKYNRPLAKIDPLLCTGCEICAQVCPRDAILFRDQVMAKKEATEVKS